MYVGQRPKNYLLTQPINENGWHYWPDYQVRLVKNVPYITYGHMTHDGIVGYKSLLHLPTEERYSLLHIKTVEQQSHRNMVYDNIGRER